jgi:hypothetical protein
METHALSTIRKHTHMRNSSLYVIMALLLSKMSTPFTISGY